MNSSTKKIIKISSIVAAVIAALVLLYNICVYAFIFVPNYSRATKERTVEGELKFYASEENYKIHMEDTKWVEEQNCPLIEITSFDNLKLKALVLEAKTAPKATVLLMHGYHSGPVREFATIARFLHQNGYTVIMPYQRSHGPSEGKWVTFGINERIDCQDWIKKINEMYPADRPLFVGGISMGCATITMASGGDLPDNLRGFIADCGFTTPYEITYWTMTKELHIPKQVSRLLLFTCDWFGTHFANFPLDGYSTYRALSHCDRPFLFISGTDDHTVPHEMTVTNFLQYKIRNPEKAQLMLVENGPHAISYLMEKEKYETEVLKFLKKYGN